MLLRMYRYLWEFFSLILFLSQPIFRLQGINKCISYHILSYHILSQHRHQTCFRIVFNAKRKNDIFRLGVQVAIEEQAFYFCQGVYFCPCVL